MHDIFISYSSKDKTAAYAVCHALEADRIRCWIAPRDILPGDDWGRSIQEAISAGKGVVLILSKNSLASRQVQAEVILAVQETRFVVPIRIEEVSPTGALQLQLAGMHWLDAFPPPLDQHLKSLAETIRGLSTGQTRGVLRKSTEAFRIQVSLSRQRRKAPAGLLLWRPPAKEPSSPNQESL